MTDQVAVTGAEGFIGSHLVEALVRRGHRVRAMVLYNMFSSHGWLETLDAGDPGPGRRGVRRRPRPGVGAPAGRGRGGRLPPGRARLGALFLLRPAILRGHQHDRHPARAGGGTRLRDPAAGAHLDQRDLRHGADGPDQRGTPAAGPVAVRGLQGRRGQAGRVLLPELRDSRRDAAAVQHVRPAPVRPRRHPGGHHPARRRAPASSSWARSTRPATSATSPTPSRRSSPGRGPGIGGDRRGVQRRPRRGRGDRPARRGHRRPDGRRGRHHRGRPAAAAQGLRGDAAGLRRVQAA